MPTLRIPFAIVALFSTIAAAQTPAASAKVACPKLPSIDSIALMNDVARLADDSMRGRRVGTPENAKAREFIGARFDALKLTTLGKGRFAPFTFAARGGRGGQPAAGAPARPPVQGSNVIGVIKGSKYPDQYIVVSSHFDHIGFAGEGQCRAIGADSVCNGADDNASGTSAVMQLAKYFSQVKPEHSIIFATFDAEESGDMGSHAWVDSLPVPVSSVLIDINMDMIGRNVKNELYAAGPTKYPQLAPLVNASIACAPAAVKLISGHDGDAGRDDWTNQSDQGAFNKVGIPFIYFGEEDHPDYHKAGDQVERLMPAFYVASARMVADFVQRFDANPPPKGK